MRFKPKINLKFFLVLVLLVGSTTGIVYQISWQRGMAKTKLYENGFTIAYQLSSVERGFRNEGFGGGVADDRNKPMNSYLDDPERFTWLRHLNLLDIANPIVYVNGERSPSDKKNSPGFTDDEIRPLENVSSVLELDLSHNSITDVGLSYISGNRGMRKLALNGCEITDRGLNAIGKLKALEELSLANTSVTNIGLKQLSGLKNLRHLNLNGTKVSGSGLQSLACCTQLETLKLGRTQIQQEEVGNLDRFTNVNDLDVSGTDIEDLNSVVERLPKLVSLNVAGTKIDDTLIGALNGRTMNLLRVDDTGVTDASLTAILDLNIVSVFTAVNTQISGENRMLINKLIRQRVLERGRKKASQSNNK